MDKIKFYCVTNKKIQFIEDKNYNFGWVGQDKPPETYLSCNTLDNIYYKEKYYSELTFHYWFWKNILKYEDDDTWIGFCQKRRYWIREHINNLIDKSNINHYLLKEIDNDSHFDAIICNPVSTSGIKKTKLIKKGWKNLVKNPIIFFNDKYQNIELHFDMHHGYGNLNAAIQLISSNDRDEFSNYVKKKN